MADYQTINTGRVSAGYGVIDEGLKSHMNKVYGLMAVAMIVSGLVAWAVGTNPAMINAIFGTPLKWVVMFAPLVV
ncbi:MAG: BAX inhibitor (BI)-1/YccA family protein, partial [Rhodobacteraceae bacterium]|nr:BAX inhibitor (BI)-1/YccA family protein [Paracoccaceae bacterium]